MDEWLWKGPVMWRTMFSAGPLEVKSRKVKEGVIKAIQSTESGDIC